jgi:YidC/Oxa1 family membrane protein insertase
MTEFRNPNQEPGMDNRLLLVIAMTFVVLLLAQPLLMKYGKKSEPAPTPSPAATAPPATSVPSQPAQASPASPALQASAESEIVVENALYRIVFSNRGAQVKSWVLKRYDDERGRPLDLVNHTAQVETQQNGIATLEPAPARFGYPMSLWTWDQNLRGKLNAALWVCDGPATLQVPASLTCDYSDGELTARKSFHFDHSYLVGIESQVTSHGQLVSAYPAWPAGFGDQVLPTGYASARVDYQSGDKVTRLDAKKVSGGTTYRVFNWAGAADQYFGAVFLPAQPDDALMIALHESAQIPKNAEKPDPKEMQPVPLLGFAAGSGSGPTVGRWFVGPKAVDVLDGIRATPAAGQGVGPSLGGMVDFGFFGWVGKPLFLWLKWTEHHVVPNWGWSIAFLTIVINLALLPLRITSMKSALKMQKIQPEVNDIKKKYEKLPMRDPRRTEMNQEISALFKERHVNPASGCLPMLIQMPFLWAFYTMLSATIELRHQPWLWIRDLSSPDPYHILPVLIIGSTWLMQKMTPTPGVDPAQARMMNLMMPVMLGVFSWAVAAGLGLYWLLGTLIAIVTQQVLNRTTLGQEMRAIAEKRARRREGRAEPKVLRAQGKRVK